MTMRLYCNECGWHPEFRCQRAARRAAARHHCTSTPQVTTRPHWWIRLWTNLWTNTDAVPAETGPSTVPMLPESPSGASQPHDRDGSSIQWTVLAAHHAENTRQARLAIVELVRAGYQIGPPPYGYRALRLRVTDATGRGRLRTVLVPHWQTAAVVRGIFRWRADERLGFAPIAARLNGDPHQYPPPVQPGRWTPAAVRRIVTNPKYVGRQTWGRTVAGRPVAIEQWVTSAPNAHEPLVDFRTFMRAQPGRHNEGGDDALSA